MPEKLPKTLCCNHPANIERDARSHEDKSIHGVGIWCDHCPNSVFVPESEEFAENKAIEEFMKNVNCVQVKDGKQGTPRVGKTTGTKKETKPKMSTQLSTVTRMDIAKVFNDRKKDIIKMASPVISEDNSAMERFYNNNAVRYPLSLKGPAWDRIWSNEAGQLSIIKGIEDSLIDCVELGVTGHLVPFGDVCQLIAGVESYEFRLTFGNNAPFEKIKIKCIYEGDEYESGENKSGYFMSITKEGPKEKVRMVSVSGKLKRTGLIEGETYSAKRLLEKAAAHSGPYKNYIRIMKAYEYQKSEDRVKTDPNGREFFSYFTVKDVSTDKYFQKSVDNFRNQESAGMLKKDGRGEYAVEVIPKGKNGPWEKKLYRDELEGSKEEKIIFMDELENPYAGADQPEMLRKGAGKSFLGKYAKVRNSEAAMNEVRTHEDILDATLNNAADNLDGEFEEVK